VVGVERKRGSGVVPPVGAALKA